MVYFVCPELARMLAHNNNNSVMANGHNHRMRLDSFMDGGEIVQEVDDIMIPEVGMVQVPVVKGDFASIPANVQQFIAKYVSDHCNSRICFG